MDKKNKSLYLASSSKGRRELLTQADIPFKLIEQNANEIYSGVKSLQEIVVMLAIRKMDHAQLLPSFNGNIMYVLSADTMVENCFKKIMGKPKDNEEVQSQIQSINQGPCLVSTGFCLEKKIFDEDKWHTQSQIVEAVTTECLFFISDYWINKYLSLTDSFNIAGSITIEGFGSQFLKEIHGSYSNIIGLPLFEVRQALETLDFFN